MKFLTRSFIEQVSIALLLWARHGVQQSVSLTRPALVAFPRFWGRQSSSVNDQGHNLLLKKC